MLCIYNRLEGLPRPDREKRYAMTEAMFARQAYDGLLNFSSIKRLKRAIDLIIAISTEKEAIDFKTGKPFKFKLNFITLTLPSAQGTRTDKQIKKECLDVWFKSAKRVFKLNNYVWRAERQKNGNLHFHLITDVYIRYDELRDSWNQRLERLNFITEFEKIHGHRHPNSTDVHSIKKVRDLAAYMVKYMCKLKKNEQKIDGKIWDCSVNLKRKDSAEFIIDSDTADLINNAIEIHKCRFKVTDQCTLIFIDESKFNQVITGMHKQKYDEWLNSVRN